MVASFHIIYNLLFTNPAIRRYVAYDIDRNSKPYINTYVIVLTKALKSITIDLGYFTILYVRRWLF
jgi:hypothetical protein